MVAQEIIKENAPSTNGNVKMVNSALAKNISVMVLKPMVMKLLGTKTVKISLMKINRYVVRKKTDS